MKKLLILLLCLAGWQAIQAQSALFNKYADTQGVTTVQISKAMFRLMGNMNVKDMDMKKMANKLEQVKILSCERPSLVASISKEARLELKKQRFEVMMQMSDNGENTTIYCKQHANNRNEFVLLNTENSEVNVINLLGNITLEDIKEIKK